MSGWRQPGGPAAAVHLSLFGIAVGHPRPVPPADELLNYSELPMPVQALTPRIVLITASATVGIVPDGVARVVWQLADPGQRRPVTVHPRVSGNVAIAPATRAPASTRLLTEQLLVGATWYDAQGRVLAAFHESLARIDRAHSR